MSTPLITVEQAAQQLGLHPKTVLRHIREGRLRATRIGKSYRITSTDLNAFAGLDAGPAAGTRTIRATCTIDLKGLSAEDAYRIDTFLGAAARSRDPGRPPLHASTAYDPALRTLKVVLVGDPGDIAPMLGFFQAEGSAFR